MQISNEKRGPREKKVGDVAVEKRRLVEVPYTATLAHTLNALVANRAVAVPVAAPPGHWIGAGGSMIMESDKQTGAVRKHYIGMVTMLDILGHIGGGDGDGFDFEGIMSVPVSSIIGHCLEGLSLWTLNPHTRFALISSCLHPQCLFCCIDIYLLICSTVFILICSILDCMEMFSKGIHRALVPLDSHMENISGVELAESASSYRMLTQMDVLRFLKEHASELNSVLSCSVGELEVIHETVFGVTDGTKVMEAIKCMKVASLNAVPIIEASDGTEDCTKLINVG